MAAASETTPFAVGEIPLETQLFIGGKFVDAKSGEKFDTVDPATEKVIASVHQAGKEDIDDAVKAAAAAFEVKFFSGLSQPLSGHQSLSLMMLSKTDNKALPTNPC